MNQLLSSLLSTAAILGLAGCTSYPEVDYDKVAVSMKPMDYANTLCSGVDFSIYHDCITRVLEHQEALRDTEEPEGQSNAGTFAMAIGSEIFLGSYASDPFRMFFEARSPQHFCSGSYNAFTGSTESALDVRCNNGLRGRAKVIRDSTGRSGVGEIRMNDGQRGKIVFGPAVGGRQRA